MLKTSLALLVACALPGAACAKTIKLGGDKPVAEVTIPDGWETQMNDGILEATAPDTYLSAEIFDVRDVTEASISTGQFVADSKIKLKAETRAQKAVKVAGFPGVETSWEATDEDGPTRLRVDLVKVRDDKLLLFTYWRSETGEKSHGTEAEAIMASVKAAK